MTDCEKMKQLYNELGIRYSFKEKDFFGDMVIFLQGTNITFTFDKSGKFICKEERT
jgi:hypothetical protein